MIKIFREIRHRLLMENKTGKYLKYAIGEIILVVIGILIALQLNIANENRKAHLEEVEILKNIKLDFQNAIREFKENNAFRKRILNAMNEFYTIIQNKNHSYSKKQLDSLMAEMFISPTYNNQTGSLNLLFNSGKINLVSNSKIKEAFILWPQLVEDVKEDEIYAANNLIQELYPLIRKYVSIYDVNRRINYKDLSLFKNSNSSPFISDYSALFSNIEFEGVLSSRELSISVSLQQTQDLIDSAINIIDLIDITINTPKKD